MLKFGQVSAAHHSLINICDKLGYTMLHYAIMYEKMNCIATLIELGAGKYIYIISYNLKIMNLKRGVGINLAIKSKETRWKLCTCQHFLIYLMVSYI